MRLGHPLGTIVALLFLNSQFCTAEVGKTASETKISSSYKKVEPARAELELTEIRSSSDSGEFQQSTKPKKEAPSNKEGHEAARRVETTETTEKNKIPTPVNNKKVLHATVEASNRTLKPSRILVMLPMPLYNHTQNCMPIFKELARRGHHVTVVSPFPQNVSLPNWEEITVPNILNEIKAFQPKTDISKQRSFFEKVTSFTTFGEKAIELTLQLKPIQDLFIDDSRGFDLLFVQAQLFKEPLLAFGHKFKAPVITIFPSSIIPEVAYYTGNPLMTMTYVPHIFFPFSNSMSFVERGINAVFNLGRIVIYSLWTIPQMDRLMRQHFPSKDLPYLGDLLFNVSFTFMDTHHVISYPFPRVNNIRGYLGIGAKPTSELSQELQDYMDNGEDGVLFFSLGSYFQTSALRPHILEALLGAFARLPNKILMKWDKDEPPAGLPPNVKTQKWFPQSAILAHKNCIGFITHTGVHGLVESLDHAVPVISVPLFGDQHFFAKWVREKGVGLSVDIETVTPEIAYQTIKEVISDKKYKENVIEISKLIRDSPHSTLDELIYWTEYVIRTKGAPLLRSGALNLAWYQRFGLDLLAVAVPIIFVPIWLMIAVLKCLVSKCKNCKKPKTSTSMGKEKLKKED